MILYLQVGFEFIYELKVKDTATSVHFGMLCLIRSKHGHHNFNYCFMNYGVLILWKSTL